MKKIIIPGLIVGAIFLALSISGLYLTSYFFPNVAMQYFDPAFDAESDRILFYYIHPFIISLALSWFWSRFKAALTGSFITKGIEFGVIYALVTTFPMMWLIYSAMNVSLEMVTT